MKTLSGIGSLNPKNLLKKKEANDMKEPYGFKFKMFDEVTTKIKSDVKFMIVGRRLEECSGGIQRYYTVRAFIITKDPLRIEPRIAPATRLNDYNECELKLAE